MSQSFKELQEELDLEFLLDQESIPYRVTRGTSGVQLNIKTCPNPACQDNRWRTYFGVETGLGNCFVCGSGFSKAGFVHQYFGHQEWRDTYKKMLALLGDQGWRPRRGAMVATFEPENVQLPISVPLPLPGGNLGYLESRGFGEEITRYLGLRWCENGWWIYRDPEGARQMQNFSGRIIIPVYDLDGQLKTFQGRTTAPDVEPRYLFPKELPGTGRYIYNGHNVIATDHAVMGEGVFDAAAIKLALDEAPELRSVTAIASFGKHLSHSSADGDDQLARLVRLKGRGLRIVTIMWDGEPKALLAALDAARLLVQAGLWARVALLPAGKDPNEVLGEVVRDAYYKAEAWTPALDVKWRLRNPYA